MPPAHFFLIFFASQCFFCNFAIMETSRRTFFLGLALCVCLSLQAQIMSQLTCRRYTTQDGLPQLQTERLYQDTRGYIYIGTLSGFVRFDGRTFTPFLKGQRFNIVGFAEIEGTVRAFDFRRQWLTGFDGLEMVPIDPEGQWLLNNFNSGSLPEGFVLLEDEQEQNRRLCRLTPEGFITEVRGVKCEVRGTRCEVLDLMTPDRRLYMDSTMLYVPTPQGLYVIRQNRAIRLTAKNDVFSLLRTDDGLLAFAADGIHTVSERGLCMKTPFDFSQSSYGLIVRTLANGRLIIADEHSLYEYDGSHVQEIATGFNLIKDLLVDRWDRLWAATYQGLYCYFTRCFTNHRLTDPNDIVRAVGVDGKGQLVMGTLNGKLLASSNLPQLGEAADALEASPSQGRLEGAFFAPCTATLDGKVYMVGDGDVACYCDSGLYWLHLPHDRYQFVAEAGGRLIIGSRKCISAYHPATGAIDTLSTEVPYPWCAAQDAQGRLWVGSTFGLFADGEKVEYPQKLIVTTMQRDKQGNILFASKDSLFLIRNGEVSPLRLDALSGHEVRSLHVSPKGFLVLAAIDGLFVARLAKDYTLSDVRFFDHTNGFTALEPLMATIAETNDGTVWVCGVEEMTSFRPADLLAYSEADTYISPPLRWWQHWWVLGAGCWVLGVGCWLLARWYEKRRNRKKMIRLQAEKLQKEKQIEAIREKARAPFLSPQPEGRPDTEKTSPQEGLEGALNDIVRMTEKSYDERLTFRTASGTIAVDVQDIAFFKGDGNYSQIVTYHGTDTVLQGLGALEKRLSPEVFVRADRSTLVNIHQVCRLLPKQRRCIFRSPGGQEVETTLLAPAFRRLQELM